MAIKREYDFDQVGSKDMYLLHHEEIESTPAQTIPGVKRIRFFMTFGQSYLITQAVWRMSRKCSTTPIGIINLQEIVPIQFLKALLPDPPAWVHVLKEKLILAAFSPSKRMEKRKLLYFIMFVRHQECYKEVGSQAISYTTGVPAKVSTLMSYRKWIHSGVYTGRRI